MKRENKVLLEYIKPMEKINDYDKSYRFITTHSEWLENPESKTLVPSSK